MDFSRRKLAGADVLDGTTRNHEYHFLSKAAVAILVKAATQEGAQMAPESEVVQFCAALLQPENMPEEIDGAFIPGLSYEILMALGISLGDDVLPRLPADYQVEATQLYDRLFGAASSLTIPGASPLSVNEIETSVMAARQLLSDMPSEF